MPALRIPETPRVESLFTHPESQLELILSMTVWDWVIVGLCFAMAGLVVWRLWPREDREADLPGGENGKLVPPWKWEEIGYRPGGGKSGPGR